MSKDIADSDLLLRLVKPIRHDGSLKNPQHWWLLTQRLFKHASLPLFAGKRLRGKLRKRRLQEVINTYLALSKSVNSFDFNNLPIDIIMLKVWQRAGAGVIISSYSKLNVGRYFPEVVRLRAGRWCSDCLT